MQVVKNHEKVELFYELVVVQSCTYPFSLIWPLDLENTVYT